LRRVGGVGRADERARGGVARGGPRRVERVLATAGERDVVAGVEQCECRRAADAAACAGDDGDLVHGEPISFVYRVSESGESTVSRGGASSDEKQSANVNQ